MNYRTLIWIVATIVSCFMAVTGVELTFELADNARECFYQDIQQNVTSTLEFQVKLKLLTS